MLSYGMDVHDPPLVYMGFNILLEHLSGNDGQVVCNEAYTCSKLKETTRLVKAAWERERQTDKSIRRAMKGQMT